MSFLQWLSTDTSFIWLFISLVDHLDLEWDQAHIKRLSSMAILRKLP
jgi:hypothetical protein